MTVKLIPENLVTYEVFEELGPYFAHRQLGSGEVNRYVPSANECPLLLQLPNGEISMTNGFISPMWGSVIVWNPSRCTRDSGSFHHRNKIPQQCLREDVLVIRDGQARVKDAMNTLSRVESKLNQRLDRIEKTTKLRLDDIDLKLASIHEMNRDISDFTENQGDRVQSIWNMLRNQQSGPSHQQPGPSTTFYVEDNFIEDSSTNGEKVGEGETNDGEEQTNEGWGVWETNEAIPLRQYWIEEIMQEEESEEEFEIMQEQPIQEEHEPYYPEPIEYPILDDDMEEEANSLSLEEEASLEMVKAQRAAIDARQAERERLQAVIRSEKLKRLKVYAEERKKKMMDLAKKQGIDWEMAYKTFCGVEDGLEVNDNAEVEVIIQDIRSANPDDHTYFTALRNTVIFLKAGVKANGAWNILINFLEKGTFVISTKFFEQRTYTELQVMLIKIQRTTRLNELLREHVKEILMKVGP
ncbi:hypothetical protein POM88_020973 [Heracleum sosnowskyi]|uniref:Uncharacterized protein n=1 Tax=Heracleum sosnowskyi TaxID=360622 RepID=A0AAD8MTD3_9APIA|nr:hypothetical protein POM88_020973 [Heracleum sosnowskyi]